MRKKNLGHYNPLISIAIGIFTIILLVCGAFLYGRATNSQSFATKQQTRDLVIKTQVETAVSMLSALNQKQLNGEFSLDQAKALSSDILRELRYGDENTGYFWADTIDGTNIVLYGKQDVEGMNRWNSYIGGVYYVRETIKNGMREGGGYTDYYYPKMNDSIPLPKRGYSLLFEPFDWVIGTGYYLEDIE